MLKSVEGLGELVELAGQLCTDGLTSCRRTCGGVGVEWLEHTVAFGGDPVQPPHVRATVIGQQVGQAATGLNGPLVRLPLCRPFPHCTHVVKSNRHDDDRDEDPQSPRDRRPIKPRGCSTPASHEWLTHSRFWLAHTPPSLPLSRPRSAYLAT